MSSKQLSLGLMYSVLSVLHVLVVMTAVFAVDRLTGWGTKPGSRGNMIQKLTNPVVSFLKVCGEEVGWRCYLLPCLLQQYSSAVALFMSGVIWALYHVPIMVLLTKRFSVRPRWKTILVQSLQCVLSAFPFGYVAMHSSFSIWAPAIMHFTWNEINPWLFGSIYTQQCGHLIQGKQWLINGEGLAGCISLLPLVLLIINID